MKHNKNFLEKLVKKDYNNELEKVLEKKYYDENVKSTLLSMLYKIDASYKDLQTVKRDVETKEEYMNNLIDIIKKDCNIIKIIKINENNGLIPENKTYTINKINKEIISYPIERKLLYAIYKMSNKEKIVKDDYFIINDTLTELINVGGNLNKIEPLRDFNGYSWTVIPREIESIDHNLIYQNLRILVGSKFLNKWEKNSEFIIDNFEAFKDKLNYLYGSKNEKIIVDLVCKLSILLSMKYNEQKNKRFITDKKEVERKLKAIEDRDKFIENITKEKIDLEEKIKTIDETLNNKELLAKEYEKRNEDLPLDKKIFSAKVLANELTKDRKRYVERIVDLNRSLNPEYFLLYKNQLQKKYSLLSVLGEENIKEKINELKMQLQKDFLNALEIKLENIETKEEMEDYIYEYRYYLLLPFDFNKKIIDLKELHEKQDELKHKAINRAINLGVLEKVSDDETKNYIILKEIFSSHAIDMKED